VGHNGFTIQAQAMTALLFDFATRADYRAAVKREFDATRALFGEYIAALEKTYTSPVVPDPKLVDVSPGRTMRDRLQGRNTRS
jgi:hypothetical protein